MMWPCQFLFFKVSRYFNKYLLEMFRSILTCLAHLNERQIRNHTTDLICSAVCYLTRLAQVKPSYRLATRLPTYSHTRTRTHTHTYPRVYLYVYPPRPHPCSVSRYFGGSQSISRLDSFHAGGFRSPSRSVTHSHAHAHIQTHTPA